MKFIPLVWAGIWRERGHSILTLLQLISAFTLFGVPQGHNSGIGHALDDTHSDRLYGRASPDARQPFRPLASALIGALLPAIRAADLPEASALRAP